MAMEKLQLEVTELKSTLNSHGVKSTPNSYSTAYIPTVPPPVYTNANVTPQTHSSSYSSSSSHDSYVPNSPLSPPNTTRDYDIVTFDHNDF